MVSLEDSQTPSAQPLSSSSSSTIHRSQARSMRTIRSNIFQSEHDHDHGRDLSQSFVCPPPSDFSEILTDSTIDFRLAELATNFVKPLKTSSDSELLELSQAFSDFSVCSSDISGELQRLSCNIFQDLGVNPSAGIDPWATFLQSQSCSVEKFDGLEEIELIVRICVQGLKHVCIEVKRAAAAKLRVLAKNSAENRGLIGESAGGIEGLIGLLKCSDPWTQEHAATALLNLSLLEENKGLITEAGGVKPLVYVLKTGTEVSKQNAACALLSLAMVEDNKISIGVCGAIPPLVSLLLNGSNRGKKDALTTLYKLCSVKQNKERAVTAGVVKPLVGLVGEQGNGLADKAMVVLSSLAGIGEGKDAIVEEGGIQVLVEAIEDGSVKGKEFAVLTLLQLCKDNVRNRGLLVREGGIPPLVSLSQSGTARATNKAETLLKYLREPREEASSSTP